MNGARSGGSITLAEAARRFERWRRSSGRGKRIPQELWSLAAELAGEHGVSKTSAALRLNYYALKKRVAGAPNNEEQRPTFVEVSLGSLPAATPCVLELADARGVKLRVELPERVAGELGAVARTLWETAR